MKRFLACILLVSAQSVFGFFALDGKGPETYCGLESGNSDLFAFVRVDCGKKLLFVLNRDLEKDLPIDLDLSLFGPGLAGEDLLKSVSLADGPQVFESRLQGIVKAGQCHCYGW